MNEDYDVGIVIVEVISGKKEGEKFVVFVFLKIDYVMIKNNVEMILVG